MPARAVIVALRLVLIRGVSSKAAVRVVAGIAAVLLVVGGLGGVRVGVAHASSVPAVVVSPLPGTPDASPATQISFLGAPASRLHDIVVKGSKSGPHTGRLVFYSTHTGGSFLPSHGFAPGELVTVSATLVGYGAPVRVGTTFTVSSPYALAVPRPGKPPAVGGGEAMAFHSRPDLTPPTVSVTIPASDPTLGDIFVSPDGGPAQAGPMILAPNGQLVWFAPLPFGTTAFNLNVQTYHDAPVLTWWQGQVVGGHGQGIDVIESARYTPIATVRAGNGLDADLHDFVITPQGTAWLTAFAPEHWDLSSLGGPRDGLIDDGVVQEIDIKTGLVMFQWNALGHVPVSDTYMHTPGSTATVLDFFHVNSVDPLAGGEILISSRNTWATYLVSETTGAVIWQLGGKHGSFSLAAGANFAWQHDAEQLANGTISLFDNEASPAEATQSRVLDIALDTAAHTATLVSQLTYPGKPILAASQGDMQPLANGDAFVGWGQAGEVSEFSPAGALTFDMHFTPPTNSYRAFRIPWATQPATQPALVAEPTASGETQLYTSWNGATNVASWRVVAGTTPNTLKTLDTYPSQGFETSILAPTAAPYVRVQALSTTGALLRSSPVIKH